MDKTESMTFEIEKNHGLYDKADKYYLLRYTELINITYYVIQNYDLRCVWLYLHHDSKWPTLILKQVKLPNCLARNPSTGFHVRVRALFEWQNRLKVAVAFALDAFALCINGLFINTERDANANPVFFVLE